MKILAIDTSSKNCSVSIVEVQENKKFNIIAQENSDDERTHSVKLMPMVDDMLKKSNLSLNDIDLLACCLGPGSFTGIRIGIATIKAFADAKNIPTVGVTSLESLAYNIKNAENVCSIIDCKHNNVYCAAFSKENEQYNQTVENISNNIEKVLDIVKEIVKNPIDSKEAIKDVGLIEHINKFPNQLSGGEQQRVSIARAIAKNPKLLLCDEPTGALDSKTGVEVLKLLKKQCDRNNGSNTVIIVTHNALFADIADTVIRVKNGKIESVTPNSNPKKIDEVKW